MLMEKEAEELTVCSDGQKMLEKAKADGVTTVWERYENQSPHCNYCEQGLSCRNCAMGPCRINIKSDREKYKLGVCGADADVIVARNFGRMVAAGAASHSDHGRDLVETLHAIATGKTTDYKIKDEEKLRLIAEEVGITCDGKGVNEIAKELSETFLDEFGIIKGKLAFIARAPEQRRKLWEKIGVTPRGIDREVVEMMHRTHMGVDQEYHNIMLQASRCSLGDGWGPSMLSTELTDIMFGTPVPRRAIVDLGCLKKDQVNITVHGHEPLLAEALCLAAQEEDMLALAKKAGAKGINLAGVCCTGNEILMRRGIPVAAGFIQQEMALATGAVEAMVVDVQCVMQSVAEVAKNFHTDIITTNYRAKMPDSVHIQFEEKTPLESAKQILKKAISNYKKRGDFFIPEESKLDVVVGFSHETINYLLGGMFRASYRPLNDNIINGRIRGVAGVVGCNNARVKHNEPHITMVKELIKNDVLVITTGCNAIACAEAGLMVPEAASKYAGEGLASVCEAVGIPPVLHMGSCVDNSRILIAATAMVKDGGLGDDISDLPVAGAAPEWMSEKAISIGQYFVASGVYTVFGVTWPTTGSKEVTDFLFKDFEDIYGGMWAFEPDPIKAAQLMIAHIDKKRKALGIDKARERILYDMEMRRELA